MRILTAGLAAFFFAVSVHARPIETGSVTYLQIHKAPESSASDSQRFFVKLSGTISEATCTTGEMWFGYLNTDAGQAQYSAIMAALISGRTIKIEAENTTTCTSNTLLIRNVYLAW